MNGSVPRTLADEIRATPQQGGIVELVSGTILKRESPPAGHERALARVHGALSAHVDARDLGAVFRLPWPLELSKFDVVRPDIFFTTLETGEVGVDGFFGRPELIVEVVSPETRERDFGEKRRLYQWVGVREYWIVDPDNNSFQALTKGRNNFEVILFEGTIFTSPLLPGFELELDWLLKETN